jgi:acyl-CoA synthetase (NDP forming)
VSADRKSEREAIARLMKPRSVAVVGASADPTKTAGRPVGYLVRHGFAGGIYPVNPRVKEIGGLACYPDIAALPEAPDVGLVLLGPERATQAVRDLARRGAAAAIVLAGGYGETGEAGAARQSELKEAAGAMRLVGPNTIGIVNLVDRIMLSATGALEIGDLPPGRIAVVSQSGGILGALLSRAADRGVGYSRLISTGNEADLDVTSFMDALIDDDATGVISVYLEGLRHPQRFREVALRARAANKPIVVYKVGRSEPGARSAVSHTGALAGADRMYDALFRQLGVIRAETFSDLIDVPAALVAPRRPKGNRVAVLTSTGGAGTLVADGCGLLGLDLPDPDAPTAARLAALIDDEQAAATRNPVDVTLAGVKPDVFRAAIMALAESASYHQLVVVVGSSALANPSLAADAIVECQARIDKPILAYVSPHAPHIVSLLNRTGIPAFAAPEGCSAAAAALWRAQQDRGALPLELPAGDIAPGPIAAGVLDEAEAKALFHRFGIPVVREEAAADPAEAEMKACGLGDRVVLKVRSRRIAHKTEAGGVKVGVAAANVRAEAEVMLAKVRAATGIEPDGLLVQELVGGGLETILGFIRDPSLGLAILLGMGGVTAELVGDTAVRLLPLTVGDAEAMIQELKTGKLLSGYRGAPPRDVPALIAAIHAFAAMAETLGDRLREAEINPLFVMPEGQGVKAADGLAVLK